jgi:anti-sigma factor RsiW
MNSEHPVSDPHEQAEELLPWYATGQLDAGDRSIVEAHLLTCARCQRQLTVERKLIDGFQTVSPEVDSGWARLRGRIEAPVSRPCTSVGDFATDLWRLLTRPAVAALATAQLALLAVAAAIVPYFTTPAYEALGSSQAPPSANAIILFRPEATVGDMRDTLKASGASLVGGPTAADAYLLHVPAGKRPAALEKLQADDDVMMAEPIDEATR